MVNPAAKVNITLGTYGVTVQGFSSCMFMSAHNFSTTLVERFSKFKDVSSIFPAGSDGYLAAQAWYTPNPSESEFMIGRVKCDSVITPSTDNGVIVTGTSYSITLKDNLGVSVTATTTAVADSTLSSIVTELVSQIDAGDLQVSITNNGDDFTIARDAESDADADFSISAITSLDVGIDNAEDLVVAYNKIVDFDNDFYFVDAYDKTTVGDASSGLIGLAKTISAGSDSDPKLMIFAPSDYKALDTPYDGTLPSSDNVMGQLKHLKLKSVALLQHQYAKTFGELTYVGTNAPYQAGSIAWGQNPIDMPVTLNEQGGKLTSTQMKNLITYDATFVISEYGIVHTYGGKVTNGLWIDEVRGSQNLKIDLEAAETAFIVRKGSKLGFNDRDIAAIGNVFENVIIKYQERGFIKELLELKLPKAEDIPSTDIAERVLKNVSFAATLQSAILYVNDVDGLLTLTKEV